MHDSIENPSSSTSPFHEGERTLQERAGKRESIARFASQAIRSVLTEQHREFYTRLPFITIGHVDAQGWPWASILAGRPGFMTSPDMQTLEVSARPHAGDPLADALAPSTPLGFLGLEFASRRRNRLSGRISMADGTGFAVAVDQAFGNCPQYIQTRGFEFVREPDAAKGGADPLRLDHLDAAAVSLIESSDTFFVASAGRPGRDVRTEGVDVSHRGGRPGFVRVEGDTLTVPDYAGNFYFNTLGNFLVNPKAGLLFVDFESGDVLMLTGTTEIIWDGPEVQAFRGAERAWRLTLDHGVRIAGGLPIRWIFGDYSPNTLITGDWTEAAAIRAAQAHRDTWRSYRVTGVEDESTVIRSYHLEPQDGGGLPTFEAGQYLTVRVRPDGCERPAVRTYTLSSAPGDRQYRISVKREPARSGEHAPGLVSNHLHDVIGVGDTIEAKAPIGSFVLDASEHRPAVLIAAGVGITPMMSMLRHIAHESLRTRHGRQVTLIHSARTTGERAFFDEIRQLSQQTGGAIRCFSLISRPSPSERPGQDFNASGRITADALRQVLPLDDYDFYLCGPRAFMQRLYDILRDLGVRDIRIHTESFGPATLRRQPDEGSPAHGDAVKEADDARVRFSRSGFEQRWSQADGTLLEFAEAHGLAPEFGCRSGACGTCATVVNKGAVAYRSSPSFAVAPGSALICCAVPSDDGGDLDLDL